MTRAGVAIRVLRGAGTLRLSGLSAGARSQPDSQAQPEGNTHYSERTVLKCACRSASIMMAHFALVAYAMRASSHRGDSLKNRAAHATLRQAPPVPTSPTLARPRKAAPLAASGTPPRLPHRASREAAMEGRTCRVLHYQSLHQSMHAA